MSLERAKKKSTKQAAAPSEFRYLCPKTMKRRPLWCTKQILWELNLFLMKKLSFVQIKFVKKRLPLRNKDEDKYDNRLYSSHYPQQQTARVNVMVSLKSVNKLSNMKGSLQLKNGWLEVLALVAFFLFRTGICDSKNSWQFFVDAMFSLLRFVFKREGQIQSKFDE